MVRSESFRSRVSLARLALVHLRVGNFTFGGGDPSLAALQSEIVATKQWVTPERYSVIFALARITPGTNLLAFCAGISWELLGWPGAVAALLAMTVPAGVLVVILTRSYDALITHPVAMSVLGSVLASAVGMMVAAAWQLVRPYVRSRRWPHAVAVVLGAVLASRVLLLSPIQILAIAALVGYFWRVPE